jgi:hypothetical protein
LAFEPLETGSSEKASRVYMSDVLVFGIPVITIFTALIVGIYCIIKKRRKGLMHKGTIATFLFNPFQILCSAIKR